MNNEMPNYLKKWEAKRRLGKAKFICAYGVLTWGIPVGTIMTLANGERNGFGAASIIVAAIVWPMAGAFFGWLMWRRAEDKYQLFLASNDKPA